MIDTTNSIRHLTSRIWMSSAILAVWAVLSLAYVMPIVWSIKDERSNFAREEAARRFLETSCDEVARSFSQNIFAYLGVQKADATNTADEGRIPSGTVIPAQLKERIRISPGSLSDDLEQLVVQEATARKWSIRMNELNAHYESAAATVELAMQALRAHQCERSGREQLQLTKYIRGAVGNDSLTRASADTIDVARRSAAWNAISRELHDIDLVIASLLMFPSLDSLADLRENRLAPALERLHNWVSSPLLADDSDELHRLLNELERAILGESFHRDTRSHEVVLTDAGLLKVLQRHALMSNEQRMLRGHVERLLSSVRAGLATVRSDSIASSVAETARVDAAVTTIWSRGRSAAILGLLLLIGVCFRLPRDVSRQIVQIEACGLQIRRDARVLAEVLSRTQAVMDQTFQMTFLLTTQGRITEVNRTALEFVAVPYEQVGECYFWESQWWTHETNQKDMVRQFVLRASKGECVRFEASTVDAQDRIRTIDFSIKPVRNEDTTLALLIVEGRDVTDRKDAERRLQQSLETVAIARSRAEELALELEAQNVELERERSKATDASNSKSEFLANMSHEIRTPLTAIHGYAELLLNDDQETGLMTAEHRLDAPQVIKRNAEHLLGIINDILDLSKIEAGKMHVVQSDCSIHTIIDDAVSLMRIRSDDKGINLEVNWQTPLPIRVKTDPLRLKQILINLIGNAIKFTDKGGVRLEARLITNSGSNRIEFDVIDTGIGIREDESRNLFLPFTQADSSATRRFGGTGLGLCISRRFANMLGGEIQLVESTPGLGTRFRVQIDCGSLDGVELVNFNDIKSQKLRPSQPTSQTTAALNGFRVLLAEDSPDNQRLVQFMLRKAGAEVVVVDNGKLACEAALDAETTGRPFSVILMDMQMPVLDGYNATAQLRQNGYQGGIIALTAHAMSGDQEKCLFAGCDDYATKPIDRSALISQIVRIHSAADRCRAVAQSPESLYLKGGVGRSVAS